MVEKKEMAPVEINEEIYYITKDIAVQMENDSSLAAKILNEVMSSQGPGTCQKSSATSLKSSARNHMSSDADVELSNNGLMSLPIEILVRILQYIGVHDLLTTVIFINNCLRQIVECHHLVQEVIFEDVVNINMDILEFILSLRICSSLRVLNLSSQIICTDIEEFNNHLQNLKSALSLEELYLESCPVYDVSFVSALKALRVLDLSSSLIVDISLNFLKASKNLKYLYLSFNSLSATAVQEAAASLPKLQQLGVTGIKLSTHTYEAVLNFSLRSFQCTLVDSHDVQYALHIAEQSGVTVKII